jgi:PAS domain S-box-containing protein
MISVEHIAPLTGFHWPNARVRNGSGGPARTAPDPRAFVIWQREQFARLRLRLSGKPLTGLTNAALSAAVGSPKTIAGRSTGAFLGVRERHLTMGDPGKAKWIARPAASVALRYGLAVGSVAVAFCVAHIFMYFHLPQAFSALALSAIVITFWYGGTEPGILAASLSLLVRIYLLEVLQPEANPVARVLDVVVYALAFVIFAAVMIRVTRARDQLEVRVAERTAELTAANADLTLEIADRKRAEYLTGQVFETSPDAMALVGRGYRYQRVNPVFARNWGRPAENIVGRHMTDIVGVEAFEQTIKPHLDRCYAGEEVSYGEWFNNSLGVRYMTVTYSPLRLVSDQVEAALLIAHDLTDHMLASEALRHAQTELAHVNRVTTMGQLTASIAHEVNQPIAAVITNASAARRWAAAQPPDLEEVRQALDRIIENGERAGEVIDRIRALIKKTPARRESLDINETIREVITLTRGELLKTGVSLQTHFAKDLPLIQGDRIQLQQVMLNLIMNAVEAMSGVSDGERRLRIGTERDAPNDVLVEVRDSGPGLRPESLDHVFDAFYTTKASGMGMGLSICRSIIEAHEGRMWASANTPRGAIFRFTLSSCPETVT